LLPDNVNEKTGDYFSEVLESKHPNARTLLDVDSLPKYNPAPDFVNVDITEESVGTIAERLSGTAGLGGMDSHTLQH
jgi:hypothetical protein